MINKQKLTFSSYSCFLRESAWSFLQGLITHELLLYSSLGQMIHLYIWTGSLDSLGLGAMCKLPSLQ